MGKLCINSLIQDQFDWEIFSAPQRMKFHHCCGPWDDDYNHYLLRFLRKLSTCMTSLTFTQDNPFWKDFTSKFTPNTRWRNVIKITKRHDMMRAKVKKIILYRICYSLQKWNCISYDQVGSYCSMYNTSMFLFDFRIKPGHNFVLFFILIL